LLNSPDSSTPAAGKGWVSASDNFDKTSAQA
jgi:hypothetical protein